MEDWESNTAGLAIPELNVKLFSIFGLSIVMGAPQ